MSNLTWMCGSEWRKWDLHIHAPSIYTCAKNDQFVGTDLASKQANFINELKELKNISVLGITDYFSLEGYKKVIEHEKDLTNIDLIIPNIELRLTPETGERKKINIHILPNMNFLTVDDVESFLYKFVFKQGGKDHTCKKESLTDLGKKLDNTLSPEAAFVMGLNEFSITYQKFFEVLNEQDDNLKGNILIGVSNNSGDGASGIKDLSGIRNVIYEGVDFIFSSNASDITYFIGEGVDDTETVIQKYKSLKPCLHGSDYHGSKSGKKICIPDLDRYCWIKADPTFDGLKQVLYEPKSGERVYIGAVKPDQKDSFKVIRKIKFKNPSDFPEEIVFNNNLSSIIGSRSSGKSALLAYIAHSIIPDEVEHLIPGPGEGEEFHWNKIKNEYSIEWANGNSNDDSPGRVVYLPQNYLYAKSKDPDAIKEKIEPVLFKTVNGFEGFYNGTLSDISQANEEISAKIDEWFAASDTIGTVDEQLKLLGDKATVEKQRKDTENRIQNLKEENELSETDLETYRTVTCQVSSFEERKRQIIMELAVVSKASEENLYFNSVDITFSPSISALPTTLQEKIKSKIQTAREGILQDASKDVLEYKNILSSEQQVSQESIDKLKGDNKDLIAKYQKNVELDGLVKTVNSYTTIINKINSIEDTKKNKEVEKSTCVDLIEVSISTRLSSLESIDQHINDADQDSVSGIKFGVEYGVEQEDVERVSNGINVREKTTFVEKNQLNLEAIRSNPARFLTSIYSGEQKINAHKNKKDVCEELLTFTEKVLFTAEMEGDRIGGFAESTMTPGKRALFALRLILAESDDSWPLLIDQPEDDLDSRSIYDEVVPFLKEKKKERQIIMVSHNANLVISSDSDQLIVANRNGNDRPNQDESQFNYLTGSLEFTQQFDPDCEDTLSSQGVCEHACSILDGGKTAFENRKNKYNIT